jgi:hypothetical protein
MDNTITRKCYTRGLFYLTFYVEIKYSNGWVALLRNQKAPFIRDYYFWRNNRFSELELSTQPFFASNWCYSEVAWHINLSNLRMCPARMGYEKVKGRTDILSVPGVV